MIILNAGTPQSHREQTLRLHTGTAEGFAVLEAGTALRVVLQMPGPA